MEHYPITLVPLRHIRLDPDNAFEHNDAEIQRLVGVIQEYGYLQPIVLDATPHAVDDCCVPGEACTHYTLVGGEARVEAAKLCHYEDVPAVLTSLAETQREAAGLALNGRYGHWNEPRLTVKLKRLEMKRYDLDLTGLAPFHIKQLLAGRNDNQPDPRPDPQPQSTFTYQLLFDDATQQESFFRFLSFLKRRYPDQETTGQRLAIYVAELEEARACLDETS